LSIKSGIYSQVAVFNFEWMLKSPHRNGENETLSSSFNITCACFSCALANFF
jgi:hypothetical protein